jgi:hypothetical protein
LNYSSTKLIKSTQCPNFDNFFNHNPRIIPTDNPFCFPLKQKKSLGRNNQTEEISSERRTKREREVKFKEGNIPKRNNIHREENNQREKITK